MQWCNLVVVVVVLALSCQQVFVTSTPASYSTLQKTSSSLFATDTRRHSRLLSRLLSTRAGSTTAEVAIEDSSGSSSASSENIFGPIKSSNPLVNQLYEQLEQAKDIDDIFEIMEEVIAILFCCFLCFS